MSPVGHTGGVSHNKNAVARNRKHEPQILMGASNSNRIGWFMKISRAFVQRYLISYSCNCTGLPGRFPRTAEKKAEKNGHQSIPVEKLEHGLEWECAEVVRGAHIPS